MRDEGGGLIALQRCASISPEKSTHVNSGRVSLLEHEAVAIGSAFWVIVATGQKALQV